ASLGSYASATVKGEQEQCLPALAWSPCSPNIPGCWFFINSIDSTPYTLTLTNNGQAATGDLTFSLIDEANFGLFELAPPSGPGDCQHVSTLSVGSSCTVSITLTVPSQLGCTAPYDQP